MKNICNKLIILYVYYAIFGVYFKVKSRFLIYFKIIRDDMNSKQKRFQITHGNGILH